MNPLLPPSSIINTSSKSFKYSSLTNWSNPFFNSSFVSLPSPFSLKYWNSLIASLDSFGFPYTLSRPDALAHLKRFNHSSESPGRLNAQLYKVSGSFFIKVCRSRCKRTVLVQRNKCSYRREPVLIFRTPSPVDSGAEQYGMRNPDMPQFLNDCSFLKTICTKTTTAW